MKKYSAGVVGVALVLFAACSVKPELQTGKDSLPDIDALWDYNDAHATENKFKELVTIAQESGEEAYYAELLTQIARAQGLQMKYDDAHATLDTVETVLTPEMIRPRVRCLLERGRVYNSSGMPDSARPYFVNAWKLAAEHGEDYYAIDAVHMLQIVDPPDQQLERANLAISMAEKTEDSRARKWLGPLYNNTGWTYFDLERYTEALEMFEKGLRWRKEQNDERGVRIQTWNIARTYRALQRVDEALLMQQSLADEIEGKGLTPDGYVFEEIAECLLLLQRVDEVRPYFKKAYDVLSQDPWLQANQPERLERLLELSK
jgi:tetratricopeptide (TPR) repeat protein